MDEYEELRDVLRQISVHDPDLWLARVAVACLDDLARTVRLVRVANASPYYRRLLSAYGAVVVMEAA